MSNQTLFQGQYWDININSSFGVPGYLFVRNSRGNGDRFSDIQPNEYEEMGRMIGLATSAAEHCLDVERVFTGKFGLDAGHPLHFHIVPIYEWILDDFNQQTDLIALKKTYPDGYPVIPDGAELLKFVWHKYCFTGHSPIADNLDAIVVKLSHYIKTEKIKFGFSDE